MRAFFDTNAKRFGAGGFFASFALVVGLLFGEAPVSEQACAELAHAVALLSILGSSASAGYLAFFVFRICAGHPGPWAALSTVSRKPFADEAPDEGEDWPLLVTLLFRKIPVLFAGLGGWVEARS
jgi:hypothetical protein